MNKIDQEFTAFLNQIIKTKTPKEFHEVYTHALLPPGKLFRPKLAWAMAQEINPDIFSNSSARHNLFSFAAFLEIHHVYTLIHDDLPCMDDDDFRRGKPSLHKKFGEWKALLAGDGLLNLSYEMLFQMNSPELPLLGKLATKLLGAKGLIHGQAMDLTILDRPKKFREILEIHRLKTARLIQLSLLGGYLLAEQNQHHRHQTSKMIFRFGEQLGVIFQLLDDLTEIEEVMGEHEKAVNPWINHLFNETLWRTQRDLNQMKNFLEKSPHLTKATSEYFLKINQIILDKDCLRHLAEKKEIKKEDAQKELMPMMSILQFLGKANNLL